MEGIYEFSAYNTEKIYGYGTQDEAWLYLSWLNKDRDNPYEMCVSNLTDERADDLVFNLMETLSELDGFDADS